MPSTTGCSPDSVVRVQAVQIRKCWYNLVTYSSRCHLSTTVVHGRREVDLGPDADLQLVRRDTHNDLDGLDSGEHTHFCTVAEEAQGLAGQVNDTTKALAKVLETAGLRLFHRSADTLPCHRLALAASGFQQLETQVCDDCLQFEGGYKPCRCKESPWIVQCAKDLAMTDCRGQNPWSISSQLCQRLAMLEGLGLKNKQRDFQ